MRSITLEEHFVTRDFQKAIGSSVPLNMQATQDLLLDLDDARIRAMDESGIDIQVLSLAALGKEKLSAADQTAIFRGVDDELAAAIARHPHRYRGFCTPPLKDPKNAAKEIERSLKLPGMVGVLVDGTTDGKFLDAPEFFPVLETIAAHNVPLYIHPAPPPEPVFKAYYDHLPEPTGMLLSIAGWGWHSETAIHVLRLVLSGVLDRLPTLQIIVGHMGEALPFFLARTDAVLSGAAKHLQRSVRETLLDQLHITTSGVFTRPPFDCARAVLGIDRMMFSVDYPFSPNTKGRAFLDSLSDLPEQELVALTHGNAQKLLSTPQIL
jgi:hypothetical protein